VNAGYNPQTNSIDITAAIVQPPFYVPGADAAVNYCTIGAVIGHELTHGFDSNGRQYGPAGNLRDWWTPQATAEFKKRTDVLVQQYSEFTLLPGLKHNGRADADREHRRPGRHHPGARGAAAAAEAASRCRSYRRPEHDQRCFVAWSQMWATRRAPSACACCVSHRRPRQQFGAGIAPLMHLDAFHKAFGTRPAIRCGARPNGETCR
jgi:putative endopeptidase